MKRELLSPVAARQRKLLRVDDGAVLVHAPEPAASEGTVLTVLGLYPHARANTVDVSATEREMRKHIQVDRIVWVDLCVLSSKTTNKIIDQQAIAKFVDDEAILSNYMARLICAAFSILYLQASVVFRQRRRILDESGRWSGRWTYSWWSRLRCSACTAHRCHGHRLADAF